MVAAILVAAIFLRKPLPRLRALALGALQWSGLALLLLLLWQPALSVSMLKPQQNVVAVVVDASSSMSLEQRITQAKTLLDSGLLAKLKQRFPVRLYQAGRTIQRVETVPAQAGQPVTNLVAFEMDLVEVFRQQLSDDLYKVWPTKPLTPGEYAMVQYAEGEGEIQIWDFRVPAKN